VDAESGNDKNNGSSWKPFKTGAALLVWCFSGTSLARLTDVSGSGFRIFLFCRKFNHIVLRKR
jgi:hypothetical protein